jgi:gluconate 2-dehydrogenase alpha chain
MAQKPASHLRSAHPRYWQGQTRLGMDLARQPVDACSIYRDRLGNPLLRLTFDWHENEQNMWRFVAARAKEIMARMRPSRIVSFMPELGPYNIDDYQSTHPTGGCVMGEDPESSVTTTYGQVWDTPNVFVTGAALFPQNAGANPTGTIGAVTYRMAEALERRYFEDPEQLLE